jgi:hypothetical protein
MAKWSLDIRNEDGTWTTVGEKPSCESCKTLSKKFFRNSRTPHKLAFRIYDGIERLYLVSYDNRSTRMRWLQGNLKPRSAQEGFTRDLSSLRVLSSAVTSLRS